MLRNAWMAGKVPAVGKHFGPSGSVSSEEHLSV